MPSPLVASRHFPASSSSRSSPQTDSSAQFPPPPPLHRGKERLPQRIEGESRLHMFSFSNLTSRQRSSDLAAPRSDQYEHTTVQHEEPSRPPAARRAVSTSAINQPESSTSVAPCQTAWQKGMPIPPPPGPPPSTRSQSLNRVGSSSSSGSTVIQSSSSSRRVPVNPRLSAIPPTPADWVDENFNIVSNGANDRHVGPSRSQDGDIQKQSMLARRPAYREPSAEGIRERRSRSRANRDISADSRDTSHTASIDSHQGPADLVLATPNALTRRRQSKVRPERPLPQSGSSIQSPADMKDLLQIRSSVLTPPYTPAIGASSASQESTIRTTDIMSTPPLSSNSHSARRRAPNSATLKSTHSVIQTDIPGVKFQDSPSLERYRQVLGQESSAHSDQERLRIFARFVVEESRRHREQYGAAFDSIAADLYDITRDMWRPTSPVSERPRLEGKRSQSSAGIYARTRSPDAALPSSGSSLAELTPATDTESLCDAAEQSGWGDRFQPCLSPVPSMAVSTVPDESSSRGRSASRWWEGSKEGSTGVGDRTLGRSSKEAKYMSLHPSELQSVQAFSPALTTPTPSAAARGFPQGPDDYPPEKVGWHEEETIPIVRSGLASPTISRSPHQGQSFEAARQPPLDVS